MRLPSFFAACLLIVAGVGQMTYADEGSSVRVLPASLQGENVETPEVYAGVLNNGVF